MRIHVASHSLPVTHTLTALIIASGHEPAAADDAELVLVDELYPIPQNLPTCPCIRLSRVSGTDTLKAPFKPEQLVRLLRNRKTNHAPVLLSENWSLDPIGRNITHPEHPAITLTEKEALLLSALLAEPGSISREALLADVWGITHDIDTHTLETHIYRLRQKLGEPSPPPCDIAVENGQYRIIVNR